MTDENIINSSIYWDGRFQENWESREGPRQSRFFSHIAIDNLPDWLLEEIKRNAFSLVDWGCAQGDGTDVWASYIAADQITGVDFSHVAINQATSRYPAIRFIAEDWVGQPSEPSAQFDVVFSSNTLEHFHKPYDVLEDISLHARKAVVLALPYREYERIDEHFYSFLPENIPANLKNGFRLAWCKVVDCRFLPNTLWGGDQVIVVYGEPQWLDSLKLNLSDSLVYASDTTTEIGRLSSAISARESELIVANSLIEENKQQIARLNNLLEEKQSEFAKAIEARIHEIAKAEDKIARSLEEIDSLTSEVKVQNGEMNFLREAVAERDRWLEQYGQQIAALKSSRSWKVTRPLRMVGAVMKNQGRAQGNVSVDGVETAPVSTYEDYPLWRKRLAYLATRYRQGVRRHGLLRSIPLAVRASHRLSTSWMEKLVRRRTYEQRLQQLRKIIIGHPDFIDIFHVPMGWSTPLFQRFQHMSLQAAQLGGLALYGGHLQVDKDIFVFNRAEGNVIVFDALDDQVVHCVFNALSEASQPKLLRLQSIDLATKISDVERFLGDGIMVVYEYIDEISEEITGEIPSFVIERHKWLLKHEAVFVVATSDKLFAEVNKYRSDRCILSTNGVDLAHWRKQVPYPPADMEPALASGRTVVGYHGALANWIDYDLLEKIARDGKYELVLIGYAHDESLAQSGILQMPNVHFLGSKSYFVLSEYAAFYDIGILPFKRYELTESVSPVKLFEYMAASKPVVTTYLPECAKYKSCLVSNTHEDFMRNLVTGASSKDDAAYMEALANDAEKNSWAEKALSMYLLAGIKTVNNP
ncbi:methyltransferase domain-containing protein [Noviherbaspirillum sp. 1P10PC]|uniref:methyltransferase domain-containing protein n=1 Tax=Noviherbaspirillum sp. 1P10PC TaxID=3132292 RepID=UPI0039A38A75